MEGWSVRYPVAPLADEKFRSSGREQVDYHDNSHPLEALERSYAQRADGLVFLGVDPSYDSLRDEPRFQALLAEL